MSLDYPSTLPNPTKAAHSPRNRVSATDVPGPAAYAGRERDYSGTMSVEFFLTAEQAAAFYVWWRDDLMYGGRWFNCAWPALRPGSLVAQFLQEPTFSHVYNGAFRIAGVVQVRGATQAVSSYSDPFYANVAYLLSFDDPANPYVFPDTKGNIWVRGDAAAPTKLMVSSAVSKFGGGALLVQTAAGATSSFSIYGSPAGGTYSLGAGNKFTLEGWLWWTGNINSRMSIGAVSNSTPSVIAEITFADTNQFNFTTRLGTTDQRLVTIPTSQWVHLEMGYDGATKYWFINGALTGSAAVAVGSVQNVAGYSVQGIASGAGSPPTGYVDEIRFTAGVCRHTAAFAVPTGPFPRY